MKNQIIIIILFLFSLLFFNCLITDDLSSDSASDDTPSAEEAEENDESGDGEDEGESSGEGEDDEGGDADDDDGANGSSDSTEVSTSWPVYHHDRQHTGQTGVNGPQSATLKWKYTDTNIGQGTYPNSASFNSDGSIIYTAAGNSLLALSTDTGTQSWIDPIGGIGATAVASDGTVYVVGGSKLYAYTSAGSRKWTFGEATNSLYGEPNIGSDGVIYVGSWDYYVYAVNSDGTLKWKYQTGGAIAPLASPTLSPDESALYVGSGDPNPGEDAKDGYLYALSTSDGSLKWKKSVDQQRSSGAVVGSDGTIYVCGGGKAHAYNSDGTHKWESSKDTASNLMPALSTDGVLYVGTAEGVLFAINASSGATKWSFDDTGTNSDTSSSANTGILTTPVIGADGTVYFGAVDGKMYAVNSKGELLWSYTTGASIAENSPSIGNDGTLYFTSTDKYLYAIKDK